MVFCCGPAGEAAGGGARISPPSAREGPAEVELTMNSLPCSRFAFTARLLRRAGLAVALAVALPALPAAAATERDAAVLDLSARADTSSSHVYSAEYALRQAGIPFRTTTDVAEATASAALVVVSSRLSGSTLQDAERQQLADFVRQGGVLVLARVEDSQLWPLLGVSSAVSSKDRFTMFYLPESGAAELAWCDDPREREMPLSRPGVALSAGVVAYTPGTASVLARYEDGSAAVTRQAYGQGIVYALGVSFAAQVQTNQLNADNELQRDYSNGFEPAGDTCGFLLGGIYRSNVPHAVTLHASPGDSRAALLITHDVDASTSFQMMDRFARLEARHGVLASYFITARYFSDGLLSAFYTTYQDQLPLVTAWGHRLGSHSVGHFPDFGQAAVFPAGEPGNTRETYQPRNAGGGAATAGGTVYGELEVSRDILQADQGATIHAFRSGHLLFHKAQPAVLQALGYRFDSSLPANDLRVNFPFRCRENWSSAGALTRVWMIPMTLSDVFGDDPVSLANYREKEALWEDVVLRNAANGASTVLLIHPNRDFKVEAEADLLRRLPLDVRPMPLEQFGDFWEERDAVRFGSSLDGGALTIRVQERPPDGWVGWVVAGGQDLDSIALQLDDGSPLPFELLPWTGRDVLVVQRRFAAIRLLAPAGEECWAAGETHRLAWEWTGEIPAVDVEFSLDGGAAWQTAAPGVPNTGEYAWTVPGLGNAAVVFRVRGADGSGALDRPVDVVALRGDLNLDGRRDAGDLAALASFLSGSLRWGGPALGAPRGSADWDGSGTVTALDFLEQARAGAAAGR